VSDHARGGGGVRDDDEYMVVDKHSVPWREVAKTLYQMRCFCCWSAQKHDASVSCFLLPFYDGTRPCQMSRTPAKATTANSSRTNVVGLNQFVKMGLAASTPNTEMLPKKAANGSMLTPSVPDAIRSGSLPRLMMQKKHGACPNVRGRWR
jgi:hypothetical protein